MIYFHVQPKNDILQGLKDGFQNMQGKPESIYSDDEGAFNSKLLQDYFKNNNINNIVTRGHAPYAERAIRTVKNLIYKRLEKNADSNWHDSKILANALVTYNYKMINSITKMTPDNARQPKNRLDVKLQLELHRKNKRKYPDIKEGDKVRIYTKKKNFQKERIPIWSENVFTIEK